LPQIRVLGVLEKVEFVEELEVIFSFPGDRSVIRIERQLGVQGLEVLPK